MTVTFESAALVEYQEAAQYSERRFGLGREFVAAIEEAVGAIAKAPETFQPVGRDLRIFRMRRFPYYLFYQHVPGDDEIIIYAVTHRRRTPGFWRKRLPE